MVKLCRADQIKMEANKKKSIPVEFKSVDFYDTDILGKTLKNSKLKMGNQKPGNTKSDDDQKPGLEFHEQFFS